MTIRNYSPDPSGYGKYRQEKDDFAVVKKFAVHLHAAFCTLDHTDQCTWEYENVPNYPKPTWEGWAHERWFTQARMLMQTGIAENAILDIISIHTKGKPYES
jgi:hypothetical protein